MSVLYIESFIRVQQDSMLSCYLYAQTLCALSQVLSGLYSDNTTILLGCCPRGTIICFYVTSSPSPSYHDFKSDSYRHQSISDATKHMQLLVCTCDGQLVHCQMLRLIVYRRATLLCCVLHLVGVLRWQGCCWMSLEAQWMK